MDLLSYSGNNVVFYSSFYIRFNSVTILDKINRKNQISINVDNLFIQNDTSQCHGNMNIKMKIKT